MLQKVIYFNVLGFFPARLPSLAQARHQCKRENAMGLSVSKGLKHMAADSAEKKVKTCKDLALAN